MKKYCINCGKNNHNTIECDKPIISIGILLYYIENNKPIILLIRRKHSIGYIEFIRGNYNINNIYYIKKLLSVMTIDEKNRLLNNKFEYLWKNLWHIKSINKNDKFINNQNKFYNLKNGLFINNKFYNLKILFCDINNNWNETEWEIPKGKRKYNEIDIETAKREFFEETGISDDNYEIVNNIKLIENYKGINNYNYRNIYYVAKINKYIEPKINYSNKSQYCEISKIQWFNNKFIFNIIRPYYFEKIKVIKKALKYISNIENICINNGNK